MSLPGVSSRELINALKRDGFKRGRANAGSHQIYIKTTTSGEKIPVSVLEGKPEIKKGTLKRILKRAKISEKRFKELLR